MRARCVRCFAIRPGASGDLRWACDTSNQYSPGRYRSLPVNPPPLVYGDYYYTLSTAVLIADAKTGEEIYGRQRISTDTGGFTTSPWAYNGKVFVLSEDGDTYVIQAGPEFKVLGKNSLGEMTMATPAVAQGSLIIRTASKLYRIARTAR